MGRFPSVLALPTSDVATKLYRSIYGFAGEEESRDSNVKDTLEFSGLDIIYKKD